MLAKDLQIGGKYKFSHDITTLNYLGCNWSGNGYWHQFEKEGEQGVWCELLDTDLHLLDGCLESINKDNNNE